MGCVSLLGLVLAAAVKMFHSQMFCDQTLMFQASCFDFSEFDPAQVLWPLKVAAVVPVAAVTAVVVVDLAVIAAAAVAAAAAAVVVGLAEV